MVISQPSRFLSLTVRLVVLRIIVMSSFTCFVINMVIGVWGTQQGLWDGPVTLGASIMLISVLLHHILRLWPRKKWSARSDLIYSTVEFIAVTGCLVFIIWDGAYDYPLSLAALVSLWLSVCASFVFTVWKLRVSKYRTMGDTYDFIENDTLSNARRNSKLGRWSLLFGETTFKRRFGVDGNFIRGIRALIAVLCFLAMIALGGLVLLFQPAEQQLYFQTLRTQDPEPRENVTLQAGLVVDAGSRSPEVLVSGSADLSIIWRPESQNVPCSSVHIPDDSDQVKCSVYPPFNASSPDDFIITINYTRALQKFPASSLRAGVYLVFDTRPGDPSNVRNNAFALTTQLYPGFHLFGTTFYSLRETYANSRDLSFGVPHFNQRLIGNVQALIPDPEYATSNTDNATATLRLTYWGGPAAQYDYKIEREQSSNSVLSGLALLGGAWTFINGAFAAVFGCKLLLVLFGIKPLSIYGLVHFFQRRSSLAYGGYTLPAEELNRTIAVLREHLLDADDDVEASGASDDLNSDGEESKLEDVA